MIVLDNLNAYFNKNTESPAANNLLIKNKTLRSVFIYSCALFVPGLDLLLCEDSSLSPASLVIPAWS